MGRSCGDLDRRLYDERMPGNDQRDLDVLRTRAEDAIRRGKPTSEVRPLLERILAISSSASDDALFAHRHLAELLIEEHPWVAALHLRQVAVYVDDDDVVHALMGLCQALLGNFQSAVSAYRKALKLAPRNPWYHHNLGHLLDVALSRPEVAEEHLRLAHRMEPEEHEITASLAHCLGRLGTLDEARMLADDAVRAAPIESRSPCPARMDRGRGVRRKWAAADELSITSPPAAGR